MSQIFFLERDVKRTRCRDRHYSKPPQPKGGYMLKFAEPGARRKSRRARLTIPL